jgi:ketosteroid isomerase-like protein
LRIRRLILPDSQTRCTRPLLYNLRMRTPQPPVAAVLAFIDRINHTDLEGLLALMTGDHVLRVLDTPPVSGAALRPAWQGYFSAFPDYVIYPERISQNGDAVAVLGHTTGSHLGLPDGEESRIPVIWTAEVRGGLLARWSIVPDSPQTRHDLGLA